MAVNPLPNVAANWSQSSGSITLEEGSVDLEKKLIVLKNEKDLSNDNNEFFRAASSLLEKIPPGVEFFCCFTKPTGSFETYWYRQGNQPIKQLSGIVPPKEVENWVITNKILQFRLKYPFEAPNGS